MKLVQYRDTWFAVDSGGTSRPKYEAGEYYLPDDETLRHVEQGHADTVDASADFVAAAAFADKATTAAARAVAKAREANAAADAAEAATRLGAAPAAALPVQTPAADA